MATASLRIRVSPSSSVLLELEASSDDKTLNSPIIQSSVPVDATGKMIRDTELVPGTYEAAAILYRYGMGCFRVYSTGTPTLECLSDLTQTERSAATIVSLLPFTMTGLKPSLYDGEHQIVDLGVKQVERVETLNFSNSKSQRLRYWHRIINPSMQYATEFVDAAGAQIGEPELRDNGMVVATRECYGSIVIRYTTEYRLFRVFYDAPELGVEWTVTAATTEAEYQAELSALQAEQGTLTTLEYELRLRDIEHRHATPIRSDPRPLAELQPLMIVARLGKEIRTLTVTKDVFEPQYPQGTGQQKPTDPSTVPCYVKDVLNEAQGLYLADIYERGFGSPTQVDAMIQILDKSKRPNLSAWTYATRVP